MNYLAQIVNGAEVENADQGKDATCVETLGQSSGTANKVISCSTREVGLAS